MKINNEEKERILELHKNFIYEQKNSATYGGGSFGGAGAGGSWDATKPTSTTTKPPQNTIINKPIIDDKNVKKKQPTYQKLNWIPEKFPLKFMMTGPNIKKLQTVLYVKPTGNFYVLTEKRVAQKMDLLGLKYDRNVGVNRDTYNKLISGDYGKVKPEIKKSDLDIPKSPTGVTMNNIGINESKLLQEQSDYVMDRRANASLNATGIRTNKDYKDVNQAINKAQQSGPIDRHILMMVLSFGTAFIPVVGPFISAGIQLADAAMYYKEGDTKSAGMSAMFAVIPILGSVVSKIPGIKQLGTKGMQILASKLSKGGKNLTPIEKEVVEGISKNQELVKKELNNYVKSVSNNTASKATNPSVKETLKKIGIGGLKFAANTSAYAAVGTSYNKIYDKYNPNVGIDLTKIDIKNINPNNLKAASEIKFD
jgi:ribosomal protein S11